MNFIHMRILYIYTNAFTMLRGNYILSLLVFCTTFTQAQVSKDSAVIKKYLGDTLRFLPFPQAFLMDGIKPAKGISQWELNTISSENTNTENGVGQATIARNLYRHPAPVKRMPDTAVLAKAATGFATTCPPHSCAWYISAVQKSKKISVTNLRQMSAFLGAIDNKFDAYLWLQSQDLAESRAIPLTTTRKLFYRQVKDGFLLKLNMRISDCFITYADVTWFVGSDKKVVLIRSVVTSVSQSCI